jgi:hypothetical protein
MGQCLSEGCVGWHTYAVAAHHGGRRSQQQLQALTPRLLCLLLLLLMVVVLVVTVGLAVDLPQGCPSPARPAGQGVFLLLKQDPVLLPQGSDTAVHALGSGCWYVRWPLLLSGCAGRVSCWGAGKKSPSLAEGHKIRRIRLTHVTVVACSARCVCKGLCNNKPPRVECCAIQDRSPALHACLMHNWLTSLACL